MNKAENPEYRYSNLRTRARYGRNHDCDKCAPFHSLKKKKHRFLYIERCLIMLWDSIKYIFFSKWKTGKKMWNFSLQFRGSSLIGTEACRVQIPLYLGIETWVPILRSGFYAPLKYRMCQCSLVSMHFLICPFSSFWLTGYFWLLRRSRIVRKPNLNCSLFTLLIFIGIPFVAFISFFKWSKSVDSTF